MEPMNTTRSPCSKRLSSTPETFSPVIKPSTVRIILSLAITNQWTFRQLDINDAFLQGNLTEDVFMIQPPCFIDQQHPHHICHLRKAIYGLKQTPHAWHNELHTFLLSLGFTNSTMTCLFSFFAPLHISFSFLSM